MRISIPARYARWLPAVVVGAVVVLSGARLITLSVRERAAEMRTAAQAVVRQHAQRIATELQALAVRTRAEAQRAALILRDGNRPAHWPVPPRGIFWMSAAGTVVSTAEADDRVSGALASDWAASDPAWHASAGFFGPVRYGSEWYVAAQLPSEPGPQRPGAPEVRVVGYEGLSALLIRAHFGRLVNEGYDFELSQPEPRGAGQRPLFGSQAGNLPGAVTIGIATPADLAAGSGPDYLQLAIRPRGGWYPAQLLATDIGVLALLTWIFAFGTHDLTQSVGRARTALAATRRRLHAVHERLAAEIEQHRDLQQNLEHVRFHDLFTGLPNRRYFLDQLDRALRDMRARRRRRVAIVLVDIDRLKLINDTLGPTAGDELMVQVAQRFETVLHDSEFLLARWGGDQLALLAYDVDSGAAAQAIADQLQGARQEPFALRQHRVRIALRVGFTCIDSGLQRAEEAAREADVALSVARRNPGALSVAYTPGMGGAAVSLVSLEADLHIALARNEFRLLFQPIVDLRARRVVGAEALLRWRHPVEGLLGPEKFLALAEEARIIVPVTRWVIQRACRLAAEWHRRLPAGADFYISVNLSGSALRDPGLPEFVARVMQEMGTSARHLKFELTEGGLINDVAAAHDVLAAFHRMGIELMLDDFGTGYSSLSYLQLFPFDYVKIDRPLVSRARSERASGAIAAAVLQMASSLGLRAIAEVVETQETAQALLGMGCEFGQGYFFSAPVEAEEALRLLRNYESPPAAVPTVRVAAAEPNVEDTAIDDSQTQVLTAELEAGEPQSDESTQVLELKTGGGGVKLP
jgi:diguanylate cyclase (GGDEF)-like protein